MRKPCPVCHRHYGVELVSDRSVVVPSGLTVPVVERSWVKIECTNCGCSTRRCSTDVEAELIWNGLPIREDGDDDDELPF